MKNSEVEILMFENVLTKYTLKFSLSFSKKKLSFTAKGNDVIEKILVFATYRATSN